MDDYFTGIGTVDYSKLDWSKDDKYLAMLTGKSRSTITKERGRHAPNSRAGLRKQFGRNKHRK